MAKQIKTANSSPNLAPAYDLVIADLFKKLTKLKEGVIKLGDLGILQKKQRIITSSMKNKTFGRTFAYYQVSFKASKELKKELDK